MLSGATASGATPDALDKNLPEAIAKLLAPITGTTVPMIRAPERGRAPLLVMAHGFLGAPPDASFRFAVESSEGRAACEEPVTEEHPCRLAVPAGAIRAIVGGDVQMSDSLQIPPRGGTVNINYPGRSLLDVEALAALASREPVRAVFVTPHRQFPTTAVMPARQRARLSQLALQHRFAIIEEEEDHEFYYEEKPLLPISAGSSNAIYVGSLSNFLTPGLGTGFIFAPPLALERLAALKAASDPKGDAAVECAIAELFEDGEMLRHMRRMRRVYGSRRDALADALRRHLKEAIAFSVPDGGMALWARVDDSIDVSEWARAANLEGVIFCDSRAYDFFHRDQPFVRLGFTYHDEAELAEAVRRMGRALKNMSHVRHKISRRAASSR
jgi:hypothetical protein